MTLRTLAPPPADSELHLAAELRGELAAWAERGHPHETCGLLVGRAGERRALQNVADDVLHEHRRTGSDESELRVSSHDASLSGRILCGNIERGAHQAPGVVGRGRGQHLVDGPLLHDLAAHKRMSLASCLEETLLHTLDGVGPHTSGDLRHVEVLKRKHGIDYDTHASYRFVEKQDDPARSE